MQLVLKGRGFSRAEQVLYLCHSERASAREEPAFPDFAAPGKPGGSPSTAIRSLTPVLVFLDKPAPGAQFRGLGIERLFGFPMGLRELHMRTTAIILSLTAVLLGATLSAQQPAPSQTPTFKAQTDLVLVPVVVTRSGKHLAGLKATDFTLLEDGVKQTVASFEEVSGKVAPAWQKPIPGVFSNAVPVDQQPARVAVFVLDLLNTPSIKQGYARESLLKFLAAIPESHDPMMLATFTDSGLTVLHDFTSDPAVLMAAVAKVKTTVNEAESNNPGSQREQATELANAIGSARKLNPAEIDQLINSFNGMDTHYLQSRAIDRTQLTLELMQQLARALSGVPGRKSLVWATEGINFTVGTEMPNTWGGIGKRAQREGVGWAVGEANQMFDTTWQMLSDANIAVYPIELAELDNPGFRAPDFRSPAVPEGPLAGSLMGTGWGLKAQAMTGFNEKTGGRYCPLQSKLEDCFRRAMDDSAQYYLLSYYASAKGKAGWRKLEIKVAAPGVQVRARNGYYHRGGREPAELRKTEIAQALVSPLDATAIPLALHWTDAPTREAGKPVKLAFEIFIDPRAIAFDGDQQNHFHLSLTAAARNHAGEVAGELAKELEGHPQPDQLSKLHQTGLLYRDTVEVPAGENDVRFVVRDEISGRMGSVTAKLEAEVLRK